MNLVLLNFFSRLASDFHKNFIQEDRYLLVLEGLFNTVRIAFFATLIGVVLGVIVGIIKVTYFQTKKLGFLNALCNIYLAIIRGTPVVVQLLIWYMVIFASLGREWALYIAILGFGVNSGAYVSEIIRAGILSIDKGQMEAGESLGMTRGMTMRYIILPQAVKNILPALFNEFITLVKETSVAGYITVVELTKSIELIQSRSWTPFLPYIVVALIYFIIVMGLTSLLKVMERRLGKSDRR